MDYNIRYKDIQIQKQIRKAKEVLSVIIAIIVFLLAMIIGGMTFPY